jgi:fumarate hydratase subunit beta
MTEVKNITTPLTDDVVRDLRIGDVVRINGVVYTARDAAHKCLMELVEKGEKLPFDIEGAVIYYVGPAPPKPGHVIGSAGPTTSYRMNAYAPILIKLGQKGMIGKGAMGPEVQKAMQEHTAVYFAATGGAGALLGKCIKKAEVIAYEDLGAEAIRRLEVENFPVVVAQDCHGGDQYVEGMKEYTRE